MVTQWMAYIMIFLAVITAVALQFTNAPYGKHVSDKYGRKMNTRLAWLIQESPSFYIPILWMLSCGFATIDTSWANCIIVGGFLVHYFHR